MLQTFPPPAFRIFRSIELSDLVRDNVQIVPDAVWLRLTAAPAAPPLQLSLYQMESRQQEARAVLNHGPISEQVLENGASVVLRPSQLFRLKSSEGREVSIEQQPGRRGCAEFATIHSLYFHKKFNSSNGLGQPHSEVAYFKAYYSQLHPEFGQRPLQVLDLGCGRGRNGALFAGDQQQDYRVLGLDRSPESLGAWNAMAQSEGLDRDAKMIGRLVDLNQWREAAPHDIAMAIVSLQFLEAALELLRHCMQQARPGALHLAVFPIASRHAGVVWPGGFYFLPESEEMKLFYMQQGWSILEYRENYGHLGKPAGDGLPLRGPFATLIAQNAF